MNIPSFFNFLVLRVLFSLIGAQALREASPFCLYFKPDCVNLPKSLCYLADFS